MKETRALHIDSFPEKEVERERKKSPMSVISSIRSIPPPFVSRTFCNDPSLHLIWPPAEKQRANFISEKPPRPRIFPL